MVGAGVLWRQATAAPEVTAPRVRCAIYTRKSSEEGLDQPFNSLRPQREACEAYLGRVCNIVGVGLRRKIRNAYVATPIRFSDPRVGDGSEPLICGLCDSVHPYAALGKKEPALRVRWLRRKFVLSTAAIQTTRATQIVQRLTPFLTCGE
jgi:hypothetical protein